MDHGVRASRLENWLRLYSSNGTLQTTVSDPKPSRSGGVTSAVFGPTTLFTVTTVSPNDDRKDMWSVERSMSDFTALRSALVSRFPGAVLAHLPESRMTDITKSKEEKTTKQGEILNHFLRFLCRHPFISQDQVFLAFLSVTSKFADALKAVAPDSAPSSKFSLKMLGSSTRSRRRSLEKGTSTSNVSEEPVMAMDWWKEAIDLAAAPPDPLKLSKDVLSELERIKKRVSDLKSLIRDFKEKLKGVGTTCLDLNKAFQNWIAVEYYPDAVAVAAENGNEASSNSTHTQPVPDANGMVMISMSMPVLLAENANRFHNQGLIHQRMALDAAATLLSAVREEILVLDALKEQVVAARDAVQKVEDAKAHLAKKEKELAMIEEQARLERGMGAVNGGSSDPMFANEGESSDPVFEKKTRAARRARDDAILSLDSATVAASTLTRSTLNLELNFFREERIIRSDKFFTEFARVHSEYCAKSLEVWTMEPVHGLPHPPVPADALTASLTTSPVKDRVGRLQTAKSTLIKAGICDSHLKEEETDEHTEDEDYRERNGSGVNGDQLIEWGPNIPWDPKVARLVQIAFDFDPEHDDELYGRQGDRGTAVPFDDERQWLHVKLENGRSGIIPTDFIRIVAASPRASDVKLKQKANNKSSSFSDSINDDDENKSSARMEELETELGAMKAEIAKLKKDLADKDEFMAFRNEQLTEAEDQVTEFRAANKNLQLDLDRVTSERDRALNERDRALNERDRALNERDQALAAVARAESRQQAQPSSRSNGEQQKQPSPAASRQSVGSVNSSTASANEDLPPNWVKVLDKQRNRYFYHNTVTKQSVWKKPEFHEIKASMPSSQGSKRKQGDQ